MDFLGLNDTLNIWVTIDFLHKHSGIPSSMVETLAQNAHKVLCEFSLNFVQQIAPKHRYRRLFSQYHSLKARLAARLVRLLTLGALQASDFGVDGQRSVNFYAIPCTQQVGAGVT